MSTHPHRIDPIARDERRTSRNCLRVDYISDGIEPRCNLRPKDDMGRWVLENRPYHLREMIECFDYCIGPDEGCDACRIAIRAYAEIEPHVPFIRVTIRVVRRESGRMQVVTLGQCTWYDLYTGVGINDVATWIKAKGGALGVTKQDDADPDSVNYHGRYREGFINGLRLDHRFWPPHVERFAQKD